MIGLTTPREHIVNGAKLDKSRDLQLDNVRGIVVP